MERVSWWQIGKNGRTLFDRPKPTVGCSANGIIILIIIMNTNVRSIYCFN